MRHTSHGNAVNGALAGRGVVRGRGGRRGMVADETGLPASSATLCATTPAHGVSWCAGEL